MQETTSTPNKKLNSKERLFVEAYTGDPLEAATIAGYQGADNYRRAQGNKLLSQPYIMEAIKARSRYLTKTKNIIASRDDRMEMWTNIMNNHDPNHKETKDSFGAPVPEGNIPMNMRLKASELLGKSEGDFIERLDVSGTVTISDVIKDSYQIEGEKPLEAIEAEYMVMREKRKRDAAKQEEEDDTPSSLDNDISSLDALI